MGADLVGGGRAGVGVEEVRVVGAQAISMRVGAIVGAILAYAVATGDQCVSEMWTGGSDSGPVLPR